MRTRCMVMVVFRHWAFHAGPAGTARVRSHWLAVSNTCEESLQVHVVGVGSGLLCVHDDGEKASVLALL